MATRDRLTVDEVQAELMIPREQAETLFSQAQEAQETLDLVGPIVKFSSNEVLITGVNSFERVMNYANILRFVLTSDSTTIDSVCPRRVERVEAISGVVPQNVPASNVVLNKSLLDALADLVDGMLGRLMIQQGERSVVKTKELLLCIQLFGLFPFLGVN